LKNSAAAEIVMPTITAITMPAIAPPERPEFDAEGVLLAVFVAEPARRGCEEKLEKEDEDVLVPRIVVVPRIVADPRVVVDPRIVVEMISGVPGSD